MITALALTLEAFEELGAREDPAADIAAKMKSLEASVKNIAHNIQGFNEDANEQEEDKGKAKEPPVDPFECVFLILRGCVFPRHCC